MTPNHTAHLPARVSTPFWSGARSACYRRERLSQDESGDVCYWMPTRRATKYASQCEKLSVSAPPRASGPSMYFAFSLSAQCLIEAS